MVASRLRFAVIAAVVLALSLALPVMASAVGTASVSGRVIDSASLAPVAGATVEIMDGDTFEPSGSATSSVAGTFTVGSLPAGMQFLMVSAPGYEEYFDVVELLDGQALAYGDVELDKIVPTVSGSVVDTASAAVADASVFAYQYDPAEAIWYEVDFAETDAAGTWGMELPGGVYRFGFDAFNKKAQFFNKKATLETADNVTLSADTPRGGINAVLSASTRSISGTVTSADGGAAVPGMWVFAAIEEGGELVAEAIAETAVDGSYSFYDLPAGSYYVVAGLTPDADFVVYQPQFYDGADAPEDAEQVAFSAAEVTGIDFVLDPAEKSISGVVTGQTSALPLSGAFVSLFESGSVEPTQVAMTDPNGAYAFYELPDGIYRVGHPGDLPVVGDPFDPESIAWFGPAFYNGRATLAEADPIDYPAGAEVSDIDLALPDGVASVTGSVTASDTAEPLPDVEVFALIKNGDEWLYASSSLTTASGGYELFGLTSGDYAIGAWGGWDASGTVLYQGGFYDGVSTPESATLVAANVTSTVTDIDFALEPAPAVVTGVVKDTRGAAVEDAYVSVEQLLEVDEGVFEWVEVAWGASDASGAFEAVQSEPGPVASGTVRVSIDGGPDFFFEWYSNQRVAEKATPITLVAGTPKDLGTIVLDDFVAQSTRISGSTRYTAAVNIARDMTSGWADTTHVILASGEDRAAADPLVAGGLVWAYDGAPVLLVTAADVPSAVRAAIREIVEANGDITIHVVGGTTSVPEARLNQIRTSLGADAVHVTFDRINGRNRYDNGRLIINRMREVRPDMPDFALAANGADSTKFFDALALSAVSARTGAPILLVKQNSVPAETAAVLKTLPLTPGNVWVAGGTRTVSGTVVKALGSSEAKRLAGPNRFTTAIAVSEMAIQRGWLSDTAVGVAATLPDALTGGAATGYRGGSLLLTTSDPLQVDTGEYLMMLAPTLSDTMGGPAQVWVFGGTKSITERTRRQIDAAIAPF